MSLSVVSVAAPQAVAAPQISYRQTAHGQWLCTVSHGAADEAAAQALTQSYQQTLRVAAQKAQAQYSAATAVVSTFAGLTPENVAQATGFALMAAELKAAGFNEHDIVAIALGTTDAASLIQPTATKALLGEYAEASINRADQYRSGTPSGTRAPLLSAAQDTNFSEKFRAILAQAEAETALADAIATFEAEAGNAAVKKAWDECVTELQAKGMVLGVDPSIPEIPVPLLKDSGGNGSSGSSGSSGSGSAQSGALEGPLVLLALTAISAVVVGAAVAANGGGAAFALR